MRSPQAGLIEGRQRWHTHHQLGTGFVAVRGSCSVLSLHPLVTLFRTYVSMLKHITIWFLSLATGSNFGPMPSYSWKYWTQKSPFPHSHLSYARLLWYKYYNTNYLHILVYFFLWINIHKQAYLLCNKGYLAHNTNSFFQQLLGRQITVSYGSWKLQFLHFYIILLQSERVCVSVLLIMYQMIYIILTQMQDHSNLKRLPPPKIQLSAKGKCIYPNPRQPLDNKMYAKNMQFTINFIC